MTSSEWKGKLVTNYETETHYVMKGKHWISIVPKTGMVELLCGPLSKPPTTETL